jgi:hypothetical protein
MSNFNVKVPTDLYEFVKSRARINRRTVSQELLWIVEDYMLEQMEKNPPLCGEEIQVEPPKSDTVVKSALSERPAYIDRYAGLTGEARLAAMDKDINDSYLPDK